MLISDGAAGRTVEDVLRALGAVLDARRARGVVLIEVPEGVLVRARVSPALDADPDAPSVSLEEAFGRQEMLERSIAAVELRGTGHRAGALERDLRALGRFIDTHELHQVTLMEHETGGWHLWHRSRSAGRHVLVTFGAEELEQASSEARQGREGMAVAL